MGKRDLFADLRRALEESLGSPEAATRAELRIRQQLGGERVYVPKDPAAGKARRLGAEFAAGVPLREAFKNVGVSRAWGYRLCRRRFAR